VEYYHLDALGSVRAVTDAQGQVIVRHDFLPFGDELSPQNPPRDRKLFTGQERDFETGLDYFHARQLRVDLGRFTTPDPVTDLAWTDGTLGATNAHSYVVNNPLGFVDPDGRVYIVCAKVGGGGCTMVEDKDFLNDLIQGGGNFKVEGNILRAMDDGVWVDAGTVIHFDDPPEESLQLPPWSGMAGPKVAEGPAGGGGAFAAISAPVAPKPPTNIKSCMYNAIHEYFIGDDDRVKLTVVLHVAAKVATKRAPGVALPGPGWLYVSVATLYDVAGVGKAYVDCTQR
jgi:RHS repeat-associated protein